MTELKPTNRQRLLEAIQNLWGLSRLDLGSRTTEQIKNGLTDHQVKRINFYLTKRGN